MSLDSFTLDDQIQLCLHMLSTCFSDINNKGKNALIQIGKPALPALSAAETITGIKREIREIRILIENPSSIARPTLPPHYLESLSYTVHDEMYSELEHHENRFGQLLIPALIRKYNDDITEFLIEVLNDTQPTYPMDGFAVAIIGLTRLGNERALEAVGKIMIDRTKLMAAVEVLTNQAPTPETIHATFPALQKFWLDDTPSNRNKPEYIRLLPLSRAVGDRRFAADLLVGAANPITIDAFVKVLGDEDDGLVGKAATGLLRIGTPKSYRAVLDWIKERPDSHAVLSRANYNDRV